MRLITRSDFDGLMCGALLREAGIIDSWKFVHPKDVQDGKIEVTDNDVLANVPYVKGCKLWFDHHVSEEERLQGGIEVEGKLGNAPSTARLVYDYYNGDEKFPHLSEMVKAVDKVDSANLTADEILNPTGWVLLGFICDPRTGLGRVHTYRISNYQLMESLIELARQHTIEELLELPDIKERVVVYFEQDKLFREMIKAHTRTDGNVIVTDLRDVSQIYTGNRFIIYSLYPEQNISVWVVEGKQKQNCSIAVGYSVLNRTAKVNVGSLMLKYGGGGHKAVGTCQVDYDDTSRVIDEIVAAIKDAE